VSEVPYPNYVGRARTNFNKSRLRRIGFLQQSSRYRSWGIEGQ
jgi:hypothetical protein